MQGEGHAKLFGHRRNNLQKFDQMLPQARRIDLAIGFKPRTESRYRQRIGSRARQCAGNHHHHIINVILAHRLEQRTRTRLTGWIVILLRALPLQNEQIEHRKTVGIKAQACRASGENPIEIGAAPIYHRHEIIADRVDTVSRHRFHALKPSGNRTFSFGAQPPHVIGDRNAFNDRPAQGGAAIGAALNQRLTIRYRLPGPDLAGPQLVQRVNNLGRPRLPDIIQTDRIMWAEPPPRLSERFFRCSSCHRVTSPPRFLS